MPTADSAARRYDEAAQLLDRAVQAGGRDPNLAYLLALAYKRQGKTQEARAAFRKITPPDANVWLQLGLLSLQEGQAAQAEQEFTRAWQMDPSSYEACHNLLMTRLTLNQLDSTLGLLPRAIELAPTPDEKRFLEVLQLLLQSCQSASRNGEYRLDPVLTDFSAEDEQRILRLARSLGQLDTVLTLLATLAASRHRSIPVQEAYVEAVLAKAKELVDRCAWGEAERLLAPIIRDKPALSGAARGTLAALYNLLGCCAALTQDFDTAIRHFQAALKLLPKDARLHQNLALANELNGDLSEADPCWNQYFDLLDGKVPQPPGQPDYVEELAYEALNRLATQYSEKERWNGALSYVQRAARMRPQDPETLERLFHLYNHAKRPEDARKVLRRLRELRPNEPQYDLYEIDLIEVKSLNDIERMLNDIDRILKRYPDDPRVEERAVNMVGNVVPLMGNLCDQLTDQMSKVIDQVRHLPNYQINWSAVREVMRDL
ncbi:MAG TPA: tetratricopeptide repeat protein, partial [Gemmataceae bacterium]|nr:tetratricopeptide repeat protein [Gemmataceae bacterium]